VRRGAGGNQTGYHYNSSRGVAGTGESDCSPLRHRSNLCLDLFASGKSAREAAILRAMSSEADLWQRWASTDPRPDKPPGDRSQHFVVVATFRCSTQNTRGNGDGDRSAIAERGKVSIAEPIVVLSDL
jgi:hypothetical protein